MKEITTYLYENDPIESEKLMTWKKERMTASVSLTKMGWDLVHKEKEGIGEILIYVDTV